MFQISIRNLNTKQQQRLRLKVDRRYILIILKLVLMKKGRVVLNLQDKRINLSKKRKVFNINKERELHLLKVKRRSQRIQE